MIRKPTRREFLGSLAAAGAAACAGIPAPRSRAVAARKRARVVFFTDVHAREGEGIASALDAASAAITRQRPDLILAGGDLIDGGFGSREADAARRWEIYLGFHRSLRAPVFPVLGNHDLVAARPEDGSDPSPDPRRMFREAFGLEKTYGSFEALGRHFVLIDSVRFPGAETPYEGGIAGEQLEWLREDLARVPPGRDVVLVSHLPLLTAFFGATGGASAPAPADRVVRNSRDVLAAFGSKRLRLVLQGHLHVEESLKWRGTMFHTGGAVCGNWWRGSYHGTPQGFGVLDFDGDRIDWRYVRLAGESTAGTA